MFTTNKQQKIPLEGKMKAEKIKEILLERRDKLTDVEKE